MSGTEPIPSGGSANEREAKKQHLLQVYRNRWAHRIFHPNFLQQVSERPELPARKFVDAHLGFIALNTYYNAMRGSLLYQLGHSLNGLEDMLTSVSETRSADVLEKQLNYEYTMAEKLRESGAEDLVDAVSTLSLSTAAIQGYALTFNWGPGGPRRTGSVVESRIGFCWDHPMNEPITAEITLEEVSDEYVDQPWMMRTDLRQLSLMSLRTPQRQ